MAIFTEIGDERGDAWARHNLAWAAFLAGDFANAETELVRAREQFKGLGDRVGVNWAEGLRAYVTYFLRRFDEAEELVSTVVAEAEQWGDTSALLMMQTLLANMRLWSGRLAEAEQVAERALSGFREVGDRYGVMNALAPLNRALAGLGKVAEARRGAEESITLGHSFGELGIALQGAAAVAMHLGDGNGALVLADKVLARHHAMGASDAEAIVIRTLALCQLGRIDDAVASIEGLTVDDFPFGQSARALVRAMAGDAEGSFLDAEAVERTVGASYFDLALARLGAVLAASASRDGDERRRRLEELSSCAMSAGDVVFIAIARRLATSDPPATPADEALPAPALSEGWLRIVDSALAVG